MVGVDDVINKLSTVIDPDLNKDIVSMGMIKDLDLNSGNLKFTLELTTPACPFNEEIEADVRKAIDELDGINNLDMNVTAKVMEGRSLDADESSTVSGALTHTADITIDVADNKTLTYSGTAISVGANTLTLSGGGTLSNTNALVLNDADSLLSLAGILTIGDVDGTAASTQVRESRLHPLQLWETMT